MTAKSRAHKVQKELKRKKNNDRSAPQPDSSPAEVISSGTIRSVSLVPLGTPGSFPVTVEAEPARDAIPERKLGFFGTWTPEIQSQEDALERELRQGPRPYNQGTD